jgi:4,5-dihydroxyphthalate decarboxylase
VLRTTLPWVTEEYDETRQIIGDDYWRYGIEANRKELESVMRYIYEQCLVKRHVEFELLFHPSTLES